MRRITAVFCILLMLVCFAACGKREKTDPGETTKTPSSQSEPESGQKTEPETKDETPPKETQAETSYLNEHLIYIGKTAGEVQQKYGETFETMQYKGLTGMLYEEKNAAFLMASEDGFVTEGNTIVDVLLYDGNILSNLKVNATFAELKQHFETISEPVQDEETEEWSLTAGIGAYHYTFFWNAEPENSPADYVCAY